MTEILISLREAIEAIESVPEGNWKASRYIKELEKLDPVEIVLCKDCEKFFWSGCELVGEKFKPIYRCRRNYDRVYHDDFCSYPVRKEDE